MKQNKTAVPNIPDTPRSGVQVMACQSVGLTSRYQIHFKSSKTTNTMFSNINLSGINHEVHFVISLYLFPKQNHIKNRRIFYCAYASLTMRQSAQIFFCLFEFFSSDFTLVPLEKETRRSSKSEQKLTLFSLNHKN